MKPGLAENAGGNVALRHELHSNNEDASLCASGSFCSIQCSGIRDNDNGLCLQSLQPWHAQYGRHLTSNSGHQAVRAGQGWLECRSPPSLVMATGSVTFQSRQGSSGMRKNSRIWAGARTCPKMSVHKSTLVWSWCDLPFVLQSWFDAGAVGFYKVWRWWTPQWLFPASGELEEKQRSLRTGQISGLRKKWD